MIIIKNIIFDLGSVILKNRSFSVLDDLNLDKDTYNNLKIFFEDDLKQDLGIETLEKKYDRLNYPKEYDNLYKEYLLHYYKYRKINMDLVNLIQRLKDNNYKVFVLSDNNKECASYIMNNPIFNNIDGWVISCDYHTVKKEEKLFNILINNNNLNASECYFIDDKPINIEIANKKGIKGFIFDESKDINKLLNDMKSNEINI